MRYMRVIVSGSILVNIFTEGEEHHVKCIKGLPKGTRFKYVIPDVYYGIAIVVEHSSFRLLDEGDEIPVFDYPLVERLDLPNLKIEES